MAPLFWAYPVNLVNIRNFKRVASASAASLKASFDLELPSGMVLHGCMLFVSSSGSAWVAPPSKPQIGSKNKVLMDKAGKRLYEPTVSFVDRVTELRWVASVLTALAVGCPELVTEAHIERAMNLYQRETGGLDRAGRTHADALKEIGVRAPIREAKIWQDGIGLKGFEDMIAEINGGT